MWEIWCPRKGSRCWAGGWAEGLGAGLGASWGFGATRSGWSRMPWRILSGYRPSQRSSPPPSHTSNTYIRPRSRDPSHPFHIHTHPFSNSSTVNSPASVLMDPAIARIFTANSQWADAVSDAEPQFFQASAKGQSPKVRCPYLYSSSGIVIMPFSNDARRCSGSAVPTRESQSQSSPPPSRATSSSIATSPSTPCSPTLPSSSSPFFLAPSLSPQPIPPG